MRAGFAFASIAILFGFSTSGSASDGKFVGELVAKLAADGRNMILMEPFSYIDANGRS
jgi:hypothetical protein